MSYSTSNIDYSRYRNSVTPGGELWNNLARAVFPETVSEMLALSAHLYEKHGVYRQGLYSAVSYFVTSIELRGISDDVPAPDRQAYTKFLNRGSQILEYASDIGAELLAYGIVFLTAHIPFERFLICPECESRYRLKEYFPGKVEFQLNAPGIGEPAFTGRCPNEDCPSITSPDSRVVFRISDVAIKPSITKPIKPVVMPPQIMRIEWSPTTGKRVPIMDTYRYSELVESVHSKSPSVLYDTRWDYIRSIALRRPLIMDETSMKCLCLDPSAAEKPKYKGWGRPKHLAAFPYAAQLVLLDTYNEIAAAEFSMPRRIISPPGTAASLKNPASAGGAGRMSVDFKNMHTPEDFKQKIQSMMSALRRDPSKVGVSPYAFQYQILGSEASEMVTSEMLEYAEDRLLRSMGVIPELYKGGIQAKVATPSMFGYKLFEKKWRLPVKKLNEGIDWLESRYEERLNWPEMTASLSSTALEHDPQTTQIILLRNQAGLVSNNTANKMLGLDGEYEEEMIKYENELREHEAQEKQFEEPKTAANRELVEGTTAEAQVIEDEQAVMGVAGQSPGAVSAPVPGGAAGGGGGPAQGMPMSPSGPYQDLGTKTGIPALQGISLPPGGAKDLQRVDQMSALARNVAMQIITVPLPQREQITEQLKSQLPNLHTFVMSELDKLENNAAQMGKEAARRGDLNPSQTGPAG